MKESYRVDERRLILLPGDEEATIAFAGEHWIKIADESILDHDFFAVALSGGSTPKKIFQHLSHFSDRLDWSKVYFFWSDERSVLPTDPESNYRMALEEGGLSKLQIPSGHIFRMVAEENIEANAKLYEEIILNKLGPHPFDLVMLGLGEDGHTASLFPHTQALEQRERLVVANYVPEKKTWRMTLTFSCINQARQSVFYVLGESKAEIVMKVLTSSLDLQQYPSQGIGTEANPAFWIMDDAASKFLLPHLK